MCVLAHAAIVQLAGGGGARGRASAGGRMEGLIPGLPTMGALRECCCGWLPKASAWCWLAAQGQQLLLAAGRGRGCKKAHSAVRTGMQPRPQGGMQLNRGSMKGPWTHLAVALRCGFAWLIGSGQSTCAPPLSLARGP